MTSNPAPHIARSDLRAGPPTGGAGNSTGLSDPLRSPVVFSSPASDEAPSFVTAKTRGGRGAGEPSPLTLARIELEAHRKAHAFLVSKGHTKSASQLQPLIKAALHRVMGLEAIDARKA